MEDGDVSFMLKHNVATFEQLQNLNSQLRALVKNFKVGRATKDEFLNYIDTEVRLMNDCKRIINADLTDTGNDEYDDTRILTKFCKNIFNVYKTMFNTFPISNSSLKNYIDFCLDNNALFTECKNFLSNITSTYHEDPEIYITVAMFMYEECYDIEEARQHFFIGSVHHSIYKPLYIEQFSMEVQNLEKTGGATLEFALETYYSVKELFEGDMDFHFMLLDKTMRMTRVMNILGVIIEDMIMEYKHSKFVWQKLVQINEQGFIYDHTSKLMSYSYCGYCIIQNCILTYEHGLKSVSSFSEQLQLWRIYLEHLKMIKESYHMRNVQIGKLIEVTAPRVLQEYVNCIKRKFDNEIIVID